MKHTYMLCPVADTVLPRPRGRAERWGQTQSWEVLYDLGLTSPLVSLCVCVCFIHITSLLVMVTFALPSEQDPLVFEKVGPKNSVGLVGLIKVHFHL